MTRLGLFSTSALICAAWLTMLFAPARAALKESVDDSLERLSHQDHNATFLCDYGYNVQYLSYHSDSGNYGSSISSAAAPIHGGGKIAREIIVAEKPLPYYPSASYSFDVGLYTDNHGKPGNLIASAAVSPSGTGCQRIKVPISPVKLDHALYWVVESPPGGQWTGQVTRKGGEWLFDARAAHGRKTLERFHGFVCDTNSCGPFS